MKNYFVAAALIICLGLMVTLTGCNTISGMGEDIQAMGRGISGAAD